MPIFQIGAAISSACGYARGIAMRTMRAGICGIGRSRSGNPLPSLEYSEGIRRGLALDVPQWVVNTAMPNRFAIDPNLIGGGYAAEGAQGVSGAGLRRRLGDFFRSGLVMLAYRAGLAGVGGSDLPRSRRLPGIDGFPPFLARRSGDVARSYVARLGQVPAFAAFSGMGRQIANLTVQLADRASIALGAAAQGQGRGGVSPLSRAARCLHAPRIWRGRIRENLPEEASGLPSGADSIHGCGSALRFPFQMGSGVRAGSAPLDLCADGAGYVLRGAGRGEDRAHGSFDAGELRRLTPPRAAVNGGTK